VKTLYKGVFRPEFLQPSRRVVKFFLHPVTCGLRHAKVTPENRLLASEGKV
jgi:hypothetical protein